MTYDSPLVCFFLVVGVILVLAGVVAQDTARDGLPVDLYWGIFLLIFGALMTFFGLKGDPAFEEPSDAAAGDPATPLHSAMQEERGGH